MLGNDMLILGVISGAIMTAELGARTLEGLNFRVEPVTGQLVDAGPAPAAVA
jgi:hypothetical protein